MAKQWQNFLGGGKEGGSKWDDLLGNPMFRAGMGVLQSQEMPRVGAGMGFLQGALGASQHSDTVRKRLEEELLQKQRATAGQTMMDLLADTPGGQSLQGPPAPGQQGPLMTQPQQSPLRQDLGNFGGMVEALAPFDPAGAARLAQQSQAANQRSDTLNRQQLNPMQRLAQTGFYDMKSIDKAYPEGPWGPFDPTKLINRNLYTSVEQKSLRDANTASQLARKNIGQLQFLRERFMEIGTDSQEGWLGRGRAFMRDVFGEGDELDTLRNQYNQLRIRYSLENLPPGAASDKDVALALKGWPNEFVDRAEMYSFMIGMEKLAVIDSAYNSSRAQYIGQHADERGWNEHWQKNSDIEIQRQFAALGMGDYNRAGKGAYGNMFSRGPGERGPGGGAGNSQMTPEQRARFRDLTQEKN